jgi:SAM-dependent methyltransferase
MAETRKAYERRVREGFFEKYLHLPVIDIGVGRIDTYDGADIIHPEAVGWDKDNGDATYMEGVPSGTYKTVYASHILEHLNDPITAIRSWFDILKPQGYLIISVPHRDLYEKKRTLPSLWNEDHKFFLLPEHSDPPHTFSFRNIIESALVGKDYDIVEFKVQQEGWKPSPPTEHSCGEISIEAIILKIK